MDAELIPDGLQFYAGLIPWLALVALGGLGAFYCLWYGLNKTNMNEYFAFGVWIVFDLAVIALGAGAFFTGFLTYIIGKKELKSIINLAVIIGFICYSGAIGMLGIDIGQPLRGWFIFWHANVHSMLTEVSFCITCYLMVLTIEYLPNILENRQLNKVREFHFFAHNLHEIMFVFAATGVFHSFLHQGSLGGMYGVMYARPYAARAMFSIWPTTFSLFILSAIASGPCFTLIITTILEKLGRKKLVKDEAKQLLAKIASRLLAVYIILKLLDTVTWVTGIAHDAGFSLGDFYRDGPFGWWTLIMEIGVFGIIPAIILNFDAARKHEGWLMLGCVMNCIGICFNRFVFTIVTTAIPVMPFEKFVGYLPTWQEWSIALAVIGYGGLVLALSYRYLPVFPHEKELNP
ncbi:MAG: polysulfide reductase NrfD [Deltaproteobacteria bacterium]|nr:polysulfide reductase NrfD [Deltaproteobacteria bacterium]